MAQAHYEPYLLSNAALQITPITNMTLNTVQRIINDLILTIYVHPLALGIKESRELYDVEMNTTTRYKEEHLHIVLRHDRGINKSICCVNKSTLK